jgi:hypothetical protein
MEVKYIFYKDNGGLELEHVVVFDCLGVSHADMARCLRLDREQILSAGFIQFGTNASNNQGSGFAPSAKAHIYGRSESLQINSNPDHEAMINKLLDLNN